MKFLATRRHLWLAIAALVILALFVFRHPILSRLGESIVSSDPPQHSDLILVLAGDFLGARVLKAAELATQGFAPSVLFSSTPYQDSSEGRWSIRMLEGKGYPPDLFAVAEHNARSTREEAVVIRSELQRRRVKRVILVTSSYHSRRASIVFKIACPGVQFLSVPAPDGHYQLDRWWADSSSRKLLVVEWIKIAGTLVLAPTLR